MSTGTVFIFDIVIKFLRSRVLFSMPFPNVFLNEENL
jgi:hypothetical protein